MVSWDPEKLTEDLGNHTVARLGLEGCFRKTEDGFFDMEYRGIDFEFRFENEDEKVLRIDILPFKKEINGLIDYVRKEVAGDSIFSKGHLLESIGNRREFNKYSKRLEYSCVREDEKKVFGQEKKIVSIFYKIRDPFLKLNRASFRDTVFSYVLAPFLSWAQRKK